MLNAGSSSVKFAVINTVDTDRAEVRGGFDNDTLTLTSRRQGEDKVCSVFLSAEEAMELWIKSLKTDYNIIAIGHRVVHGGEKFKHITKLNEESINEITDLGVLAPLHQYSALKYIKIMAEAMPGIDQYAYFDTIFHADVPTIHRMFAIPYKFYEEGVMRYGFHGIACESVLYNMERICDMSRYRKIVIAHLGNGCSATAVKEAKSPFPTIHPPPPHFYFPRCLAERPRRAVHPWQHGGSAGGHALLRCRQVRIRVSGEV